MRIGCFLLVLFINLANAEQALLSAVWAEQYIKKNHPHLLDDSEHDHVMSLYYFGHSGQRHLMGLERVRGDDYIQYFTLLLFEDEVLLGYYENIFSFPLSITNDGEVNFPLGVEGQLKKSKQPLNINILSKKIEPLCLQQREVSECYRWQPVPAK